MPKFRQKYKKIALICGVFLSAGRSTQGYRTAMEHIRKVYFIGIGGIGMSAIARFFLYKGAQVSGYDRTRTDLTQALEREGAQISYVDDVAFADASADLVIYTPAIPKDSAILNFYRSRGVELKKRAEVLGILSRHQRCLAVGGTHGKTTTSCLLTHLLHSSGIDCSAFLGGISQSLGSNFAIGKENIVVVEADEFDRSFLHLHPAVAIITSTDADHLDIYGDEMSIQESYRQFARQTHEELIHRQNLPLFYENDASPTVLQASKIVSYSATLREEEPLPDAYADNIGVRDGFFHFDYINTPKNIAFRDVQTSLCGVHNIENAVAATTAALAVGATETGIRTGLRTFAGIQRRFEFVLRRSDRVYIDDYAHHPTELKAAIAAARRLYPQERLVGVFQPHLYTRTRDFVDGFAEALDLLDEAILMDIYPARELPIEGVSSEIIFERMRLRDKTLLTKAELLPYLQQRLSDKQRPALRLLLTLGAGDIGAMVGEVRDMLG